MRSIQQTTEESDRGVSRQAKTPWKENFFIVQGKFSSHNKREVTVHGGVEHDEATNDYVEVLNECVKSQLKLEDKSVLSKHIQSKHRGEELFMTRP